ncbi:MAG TPA: hypothetical protein PLY95_03540 [Candidatus Paceibacterota bacterium]|nr:hypothetical protein [Candidatus Paceibacterota bacterium]
MSQQTLDFKPLPAPDELFYRSRKKDPQNKRLYEHLLEHGFVVNAAIRDESKLGFLCPTKRISDLRELLKNYGWTVSKPIPHGGGVNEYRLERLM